MKAAKVQRYREILAESQYVLKQNEDSIVLEQFGQTSRESKDKAIGSLPVNHGGIDGCYRQAPGPSPKLVP